MMREFLPQAEAELKFKSLPDDEMAIIQLIEKHEVILEDRNFNIEVAGMAEWFRALIFLPCLIF